MGVGGGAHTRINNLRAFQKCFWYAFDWIRHRYFFTNKFLYESNWVSHSDRVCVQTKFGNTGAVALLAVGNVSPCSHMGRESMTANGSPGGGLLGDPFKEKPATGNAHKQQPLAVGDSGICFGFWVDAKHLQGRAQPTTEESRSTMLGFSGLLCGSLLWWSSSLGWCKLSQSCPTGSSFSCPTLSPSRPRAYTGVSPTP